MRIAYLTNNIDSKNGWGRYASDLIHGVRNSGHEAVVLKERDDGLEGIPALKRGFGIFSSALKIKKLMKDCDIIHALDGYPFGVIAWLANSGLGKRLVISVQGSYGVAPLYNWKTSYFLRQAYKKADKIIAISNYTKEEVLKKTGIEGIQVINHGLDFNKFHTEHIEIERKFILSVGALKFRKGYHVSIPAFASVKKSISDLKYKIVGSQEDKKYFDYLKSIVKDKNIEDSVEFLDDLSDDELKRLYQTAKLFILTSMNYGHHFEGFGLVFLEAAAAGLPVIGTLDNGIEDAVKDGYNGILFPQGDIEATAQAISGIINDSERYSTMSRNSHGWAQSHDLSKMVSEYLEAYREII